MIDCLAGSGFFNRTGSCWSSSEAAPPPRGHKTGHRGRRSTWAHHTLRPPLSAAPHSGKLAVERGVVRTRSLEKTGHKSLD